MGNQSNVFSQGGGGNSFIEEAGAFIDTYAERIPMADRARFKEVVDTELLSMHEGNFARYGVTPLQFHGWKHVWEGK